MAAEMVFVGMPDENGRGRITCEAWLVRHVGGYELFSEQANAERFAALVEAGDEDALNAWYDELEEEALPVSDTSFSD